jgi:hypothetical protein
VERRGCSLLDASAMSWYTRNAPFHVSPVSVPHEMGYTHLVSGKLNYVGGLFRSKPEADRLCERWNEQAAIDWMVEQP